MGPNKDGITLFFKANKQTTKKQTEQTGKRTNRKTTEKKQNKQKNKQKHTLTEAVGAPNKDGITLVFNGVAF